MTNRGDVIAWVALLIFAAAAVLFTDHILSGVLATALVAGIAAPQRKIILFVQVLMLPVWVVLEFLASLGLPNYGSTALVCFGIPIVPAIWLAIRGLLIVDRDQPQALGRFGLIVALAGAAYLLPYVIATQFSEYRLLAGLGCWDLGCDKSNLGFTAYAIGSVPAGYVSIVAILLMALLAKWILNWRLSA